MKKKIAVFANGWSNEALSHAISGMKTYAAQEDFDIFVFMCFANISEHTTLMQGELNVYKLCRLEDYDGVIVFSNMLNSNETALKICKEASLLKIPVVSIGMEAPGARYVGVDGKAGMRELMMHLVKEHDVRRVVFIGGTPGHAESDERLEVTREVLRKFGRDLPDEDVCYGGWSNRRTVQAMHAIIEKRGLPDAFVCANDIMAMAAATELLHMGYEVPKDVIVTGFDCIQEAQIFYPAITSVRQNYDEVGRQCCQIIFDELRGKRSEAKRLIPTTLSVGESCCEKAEGKEHWELRKEYCSRRYQKTTDAAFMEQTERHMRLKISEVRSYADLKTSLRNHFEANHRFEGENLHLILLSDYVQNPMVSERELESKRTRSKHEVIVSLKDGKVQNIERVDRKVLIPGYEKTEGVQHVYYFLPLHYYECNYGYVVLADEPYIMREDLLFSYMEKIQQALRLLRTNLRLDMLNQNLSQLYDKDPMTGLFNRFGYENKAIPLYQESVLKKSPMMVMFVDINYMKRINDQFGHIHGDSAIKTVAEIIKANLESHWIAIRFGGDEFLIIAPNCPQEEAARVKQNILDDLEKQNNDGYRMYPISTSCGYVVTDPSRGCSLQEYIREADRLMYEIKREIHAKDQEANHIHA